MHKRTDPFFVYRHPDDVAAATGADPAPDPEGTPAAAGSDIPTVELPFTLDSIEDPNQRAWLEARQAQMQAGFTKALQQQRTQLEAVRPLQTIQERLSDPAQTRQALAELAAEHGIELEFEDDGAQPGYVDDGTPPSADPALEARLAAIEQEFQAQRQAETQAQQQQRFVSHAAASLNEYATSELGAGKTADDLPGHVRDGIVAFAMAQPRVEGDLLDMQAGIDLWKAHRAELELELRKSFVGSKDTPTPDLSGEVAEQHRDLTDRRERLKAAEAVAARHVA